ncbi:MAG: hypothetical protein R3E95_09070 [Thiolinea sp.]
MQIAFTPEQEKRIHFLVKKGGYSAPTDLLNDALKALEEKQARVHIQTGIRQIKAGQGIPAEKIFSRLEAKYKAML